jgi:hypothetical protein
MYVSMYLCTCVCMYVSMYVSMYVVLWIAEDLDYADSQRVMAVAAYEMDNILYIFVGKATIYYTKHPKTSTSKDGEQVKESLHIH